MKERTSSIPDPSQHGGLKADNTTVFKERSVLASFIYLLISFNQLKFMRLCFIHIFRYSFITKKPVPSLIHQKKKIMKITIITEPEKNDDQLW